MLLTCYVCAHQALTALLADDNKFGFIVMDGNGALFGTLSGNTRDVLHKFTVDLPKKHGSYCGSVDNIAWYYHWPTLRDLLYLPETSKSKHQWTTKILLYSILFTQFSSTSICKKIKRFFPLLISLFRTRNSANIFI